MDYEDLDTVFAKRNVSRELSAQQLGNNEHSAAAGNFDVLGLKAYETQHNVGARQGFPCVYRAVEASPHSDDLSVVYASVNRASRSGFSSSSQPTDESNQFLYNHVDRNLSYDGQRESNERKDNNTKALYSTVQRKLDQPVGYPGCGLYDAGFGDAANNSYRYFEHGLGDARLCETSVNRDGIYSFIHAESPDEGFHSTVADASLGRYYPRNDRGIYELEQPVATHRSGENIHNVNPGYCDFRELHAGSNCGDFGYGSRPFSTLDTNIYSFIGSDGVGDEHLADSRGSGDAFRARDVLQIAMGNTPTDMALTGALCTRCQQGFSKDEEIVNSSGQIWHTKCFVCAQCFQQFPEGIFYEFEGRKYCEHDFNVLFAPCCGQCKEFIIGRVIKAMNCNWHPDCFVCQLCNAPLADAGFIKNAGRALCRECNTKEKARGTGKYVCHKCHSIIEEGMIKYKGEAYHPYHFNCTTCSVELNADAREKGGELYCLRCHDKMGIPICGACRRPIEERVVYALGKSYHVEHFVCAKCEKPFLGTRHYEKKGLAYCETHYHQLFGNICFVCNCVVAGDVFTALNKAWCVDHFACSVCDRKMSQKTKFFEVDLKPVCKACYERFPAELKKRLKKAYDQQTKK